MPDVLRYRGYRIPFDSDHMLGPDMHRRYLRIVGANYDPNADVTTTTLRAVLPDELRERIRPLVAQEQERERIWKLFHAG